MNKEQFRKELEDACKFGYNKPRGRTIDSKVEPLHLNAINEYINSRLAALDDGDGVKKICYCGSLRFIEKFKEMEYQSVIDGNIALLPCCMFVDIEREYGAKSDYKAKADELHKRKIDICDEVFVLNVGGYVGDSTRGEIEYAKSIGKTIKYLE